PLVLAGYDAPGDTFETNVMGTVNVVEAGRDAARACGVGVVTTDKGYVKREVLGGYRAEDPLGGGDAYRASKAAAEVVCEAYARAAWWYRESAGANFSARDACARDIEAYLAVS